MGLNGIKRDAGSVLELGRLKKRLKPLLEDDDSSDDGKINNSQNARSTSKISDLDAGFKVNEDFAIRFEHNKKRAELHSCQWIMPNPQHCC